MDTRNARGGENSALSLLTSHRPRNVTWFQAAGLLFGDWGTSRLYVLGLAFLFAGRTSFYLILLMSLLILAVAWAYTQICRIYPDGGGVYTAAKTRSKTLAVVGALLLFADYTVTASLSVLEGFHYFGLPLQTHVQVERAKRATTQPAAAAMDAGGDIQVESSKTIAGLSAMPAGVGESRTFRELMKYDAEKHQLVFIGKSWGIFERPMEVQERDSLLHVSRDSAYQSAVQRIYKASQPAMAEAMLAWDSPGLWAIIAIAAIGCVNLLGPKHTGGAAWVVAAGMVCITLLVTFAALFSGKVDWRNIHFGSLSQSPSDMWVAFISIVLALSGVEAIANLTGVMKRPVAHTARKAIWVVAAEVAVFNVVLALFMLAIFPLDRAAHVNDMLAFLTSFYVGNWGEWMVRIIGGLLLLSAGNTAITDMISVQYLMARDGELPQFMQTLNRFGVPWVPAITATSVPIMVLMVCHNLESLAALYAIGVVGAVAINVSLCALHPRLHRMRRKVPMVMLGVVLLAIWVTLAATKLHALAFVLMVMAVGLSARAATKWYARRKGPRLSLLRQAIMEQLTPEAFSLPKILLCTYGSDALARAAMAEAQARGTSLVVCFIRQVSLSVKWDEKRSLDTDHAAQKTFARFLELGSLYKVPVIPMYDSGPEAAELIAETAAMNGAQEVLIGSSRHGRLHQIIRGSFQRKLEGLLPGEIPVRVLAVMDPEEAGDHHEA